MYAAKDGITAITTAWLFQHVVPNIHRQYAPTDTWLCSVLTLPLLFSCLSETEDVNVSAALRTRVRASYSSLAGLDEDQPIQKASLHIHRGVWGLIMVNHVLDGDGTTAAGGVEGARRGGTNEAIHEIGQTLMVRMNQLEHAQVQSHVSLTTQVGELRSFLSSQVRLLNNKIRAFSRTI